MTPAPPLVRTATSALAVPNRAGVVAALNITVVNARRAGYLLAYRCDGPIPSTSNVNFTTPAPVTTMAQVELSAAGKVCLHSQEPPT